MKWMRRIGLGIVVLLLIAVGTLLVLGRMPGANRIVGSVEIDRPPAEVWPWLTDPDKLTRWVSWLVAVEVDSTRAPGVGARSVWVMDDPNMKERLRMSEEITKWEPQRSIGVHVTMDAMFTGDIVFTLADLGGRTRVEQVFDYRYDHWLASLMEPLIRPQASAKLDGDFARFRAAIESAPPVGSPADSAATATP